MDIATLANLINAIAVTAGVIFAAVQIREFRRQQRRHSMYTVVQTFQDADFTKALHLIMELPDNLEPAEIRRRVGPDGEAAIYFVTTTWETIGVLVFQKELTLEMVDDFFSGPVVLTWQNSSPIFNRSAKSGNGTPYLVVPVVGRTHYGTGKIRVPVPANIMHRDWPENR